MKNRRLEDTRFTMRRAVEACTRVAKCELSGYWSNSSSGCSIDAVDTPS